MKFISGTTDFKLHNSAVTLGKFDGLHKGHQILIHKIIELAGKGYQSVMFTFSYHPSNLFTNKEIGLIYTEMEKRHQLEKSGLDVMISYPFTKETASMEAEQFIKEVLIDKMDAKVIVVGSDYHFGYERKGNIELLEKLSEQYNYELIVFDKIESHNQVIGSTSIREEIKKGNMETVHELLGRPYSIIGEVLHGRKLGRTLGIPTTNLIPEEDKLLPPNGVYASKTIIDGKSYEGVTNIGYKPTVGADPRVGVETHMFDFNEDVYGKIIEVELYRLERGETKFQSIDELKAQMEKDIVFAKDYFRDYQN
ncbi:bifunctional riboflavin kinase/FAD synthetase [Anaeromicropila herbilytica]|uniref:Riboflavin biosynthesis protein n=1 Tax=Anaeromicropila herbilytica TaxID=2785025 RepID=A0A7R7EMB5_9FIRM|nr:bifunctional riboflavin kinase/FAD synthetase [Anaeromicropila herbilytica]BCN31464.1 riboflavin biosynthesis protein [Anaeromicropila herbilytica]